MLKEIAPQLEKGHVVRSWMGMSVQDQLGPDLAEWFGVPGGKGVVITDVVDGGPADRAGLRPADVVVSFEGDPVIESYRLRWLTANAGPGRRVKRGVGGDGRRGRVGVGLAEKRGEAPADPPPRVVATRKDQEPFGLSVDEQPGRPGLRVSSV